MPSDTLEHFRATLFDQAGLPMAVLDTRGRILDWNRAAEHILGFRRDEAVGKSALLVRRPEDARRLELLLRRTARERRMADFETFVTRSDGSEIPVTMSVCPLADAGDRVTAVGVVLRDLRRQKVLERRLAEHERMVSIGRLAGGMSHHINNILAAVSARVELALAKGDPASARQALRLTAEGVDRLTNITWNLLLFSGAEGRPPEVCRPDAVARRVVDRLRGELAGGPVALEAEIGDTPPVRLDARGVRQVLDNLLLNAREAVGDAGTVTVRVATRGADVMLTVHDTGPGIAPDHLPHVFEPFWTTRGSLAGGTAGALGLGLTVARSLIAAAGGTIDLVSSPREGTTATVALPIAPGAAAQERNAP